MRAKNLRPFDRLSAFGTDFLPLKDRFRTELFYEVIKLGLTLSDDNVWSVALNGHYLNSAAHLSFGP